MSEIPNVEDAKTALAAANAAYEGVLAQIKKAEAMLRESSPAAAVASGTSLADASTAHHRATNDLAFLNEARDHAWQNVLDADAALKTAHVHSQWAEKLETAITNRIAAMTLHEAAREAVNSAEADYRAANAIISAAYAAGMPKPDFLRDYPLVSSSAPSQVPQLRMRPVAQERVLWGRE